MCASASRSGNGRFTDGKVSELIRRIAIRTRPLNQMARLLMGEKAAPLGREFGVSRGTGCNM